jgi:hypothetical protein
MLKCPCRSVAKFSCLIVRRRPSNIVRHGRLSTIPVMFRSEWLRKLLLPSLCRLDQSKYSDLFISANINRFNPLKPSGTLYEPPALTIGISAFCIYGFRMILSVNRDYYLNSINQLIFVMVKCGIFFAVRTEL